MNLLFLKTVCRRHWDLTFVFTSIHLSWCYFPTFVCNISDWNGKIQALILKTVNSLHCLCYPQQNYIPIEIWSKTQSHLVVPKLRSPTDDLTCEIEKIIRLLFEREFASQLVGLSFEIQIRNRQKKGKMRIWRVSRGEMKCSFMQWNLDFQWDLIKRNLTGKRLTHIHSPFLEFAWYFHHIRLNDARDLSILMLIIDCSFYEIVKI